MKWIGNRFIKILFIVIHLFCFVCNSYVFCAKQLSVIAILSKDIEFFRRALNGFKTFFSEQGINIQISEYSLKSEEDVFDIYSHISIEKPSLVLTFGEDATKNAKEKIKGIPIVFCVVYDSQKNKDINSTGVSFDLPLDLKIKTIKKMLPDIKKIGFIYSSSSINIYNETVKKCENLGIHVKAKKIESDKEFPDAIQEVAKESNCFVIIPDPQVYFAQTIKYLILESLREKFMLIGLSSLFTKAGALFSFDPDYEDLGIQAGEIALKIFNGAKPGNIEPVKPRKIKYSLNLITAERLGIQIDSKIIQEAEEVIK